MERITASRTLKHFLHRRQRPTGGNDYNPTSLYRYTMRQKFHFTDPPNVLGSP